MSPLARPIQPSQSYADAPKSLQPTVVACSVQGYMFRILTRKRPTLPQGGAKHYISRREDEAGFAFVAVKRLILGTTHRVSNEFYCRRNREQSTVKGSLVTQKNKARLKRGPPMNRFHRAFRDGIRKWSSVETGFLRQIAAAALLSWPR